MDKHFRYILVVALLLIMQPPSTQFASNASSDIEIQSDISDLLESVIEEYGFELVAVLTSNENPCIPVGLERYIIRAPHQDMDDYITSGAYNEIVSQLPMFELQPELYDLS